MGWYILKRLRALVHGSGLRPMMVVIRPERPSGVRGFGYV